MTDWQDVPIPERVLVVYAHPDDAEFFAGGTLVKWAQAGAHIILYLITSGDKGSGDTIQLDPQQVAANREQETKAAAEKLGIQQVIFQRRKDGELFNDARLRRDIVRMIRLKRPDAVMSSDPLNRWRGNERLNHPDHYTVAEAVQNAVYPAARDHLNYRELYVDEGLEPHRVTWLYMALPTDPNYRVDVTDVYQIKIDALKEHASQTGDPAEFEAKMRKRVDESLSTEDDPHYMEYYRLIRLG